MKRSSRRCSVSVLTVAMIGLWSGLVLAQSITARVTGTVQDESGAVVPGVSATVTNVETRLLHSPTGVVACCGHCDP